MDDLAPPLRMQQDAGCKRTPNASNFDVAPLAPVAAQTRTTSAALTGVHRTRDYASRLMRSVFLARGHAPADGLSESVTQRSSLVSAEAALTGIRRVQNTSLVCTSISHALCLRISCHNTSLLCTFLFRLLIFSFVSYHFSQKLFVGFASVCVLVATTAAA